MKKKLLIPIIVLMVLSASVLPVLASDWTQFAYDSLNSSIVDVSTPINEAEASLKFRLPVRAADSWDTLSNIVILEDYIYIAVGSQLLKISPDGSLQATFTYEMPVSSSPFIAGADGMIFAFVSDGAAGRVQAVDTETMTQAWISETLQGVESFSPITVYEGFVYLAVSGFDYTTWSATPGYVLGIETANDGSGTEKAFSLVYDGGLSYYWNGPVVSGNYLMQSSVEGVIQIIDRSSGNLLDEIETGSNIKTSLSLNGDNIYFGTGSGIGKAAFAQGTIDPASLDILDLGSQVTTTPVVNQGRIYVGTGDFSGGAGFFVINDSDMSIAYKAEIPGVDSWSGAEIPVAGIQSTPILTTAYGDDVYLYFSLNAKPSGLIALKDTAGQDAPDFATIFTPDEADQNATMSAFVADGSGTIYYTNDTGLLFAVEKTETAADETEETETTTSEPAGTDAETEATTEETEEEIPQTGSGSAYAREILAASLLLFVALVYLQIKSKKKNPRSDS